MSMMLKAESMNVELLRRLTTITEDTRRGIRQAYYWMGKKTVADIRKDILRKPRSGRVYIINGRRHVASVPGEAPANLTGALRKSTDFSVKGYHNLLVGYDDSTKYGARLEVGDDIVKARPAIQISIERNIKDGSYEKISEEEIKKALKYKGR